MPSAVARSTVALTSAKIAPWRAAAVSTSRHPRRASVAVGASSSPAATFHTRLKMAAASIPLSTLITMVMSLYSSLVIACSVAR